jgi:glycosyltransferase involved in cell wall biosynthesis
MPDFLSSLARTSGGAKKKLNHANVTALSRNHARASEKHQPNSPENTWRKLDLSKAELAAIFIFFQKSGLFDAGYYTTTYPDVVKAGVDPLEHFYFHGYLEGRRPNPIFDPIWYLTTYPDVKSAGKQPLLHYAFLGEREGRQPSRLFNPKWYRKAYAIPESQSALSHYLKNRVGPFSPIPEFDAKFYLETYKDIAAAGIDPFEHFLFQGYREGRNPSSEFNTRFYIKRYFNGKTDENPLLHYLEHRNETGIFPVPPEGEATIPSQVKRFTKPGPSFEEFRPLPASVKRRAKVLAYYLTQFHAIPENDKWWGTGFTEWTNIARGLPRFKDHYQPRIPRDLGFYSLASIDTMRKQVDLAKAAGVYGFVFYYYWFNGKRLLEQPLDQFLASPHIDMPFCLMWANENWTRRWDGMEGEVLIAQDYLAADDERMLGEFGRHFADRRYIRIQGRPLLMVYRPRLIPDTAKVIARWRTLFAERFGENPIIIMSQSFDDFDPTAFGMDGAIEFPPHKLTTLIPGINSELQGLDDTFEGQVFRYDDVVKCSLDERSPSFPLIKTAIPSWDNDARRQGTGLVVHGSTPAKYEAWLSTLVQRAQQNSFFGESIVCVNAWNEWCEAAYLEPDIHFGSAYLNATGRAVAGLMRDASIPRLLLVGHDAFPSGAQHLLLNIGKTLLSSFGVEIEFLLLDGGQLEPEYAAVAPLTVLKEHKALESKVRDLRDHGFAAAIVNTSASGDAVSLLAARGINTILLIHELPHLLREKGLEASARSGIASAQHVVFASTYGRDNVIKALDVPRSEKFLIQPQGSYKQITPSPAEADDLRRELGIRKSSKLVVGVGYADMRKGFDLFIQVWRLVRAVRSDVHFCWVGGIDPDLKEWLAGEITVAEETKTFHMVGYRDDVNPLFSAADAYLLTSREDPFPTVALEAMSIGVPVLAFDRTGGIPEFLKEDSLGIVVPYCDAPAMAKELEKILSGGFDQQTRTKAQDTIDKRFGFAPYVRELVRVALPELPSVSVVVPNYNYAHCLAERLYTIFDQTHPVEEIIVLDDASTDSSIDVIHDIAEERQRDLTLIIDEVNSGSVFAQWTKAAEMAKGEFIWIAEADDVSEPAFLSSMLSLMRSDPTIKIGFSDSKSIDADGTAVYSSYKPYYSSIEPSALTQTEVFEGKEFVARFLSVKNVILNVSSVLWRRDALLSALKDCQEDLADYRMAGDWRIYLECLSARGAKIAYVADALNVHRRHAQSVTHSLKAKKHVDEIRRIHDVIQHLFKLPKAALKLQAGYIDEVKRQLMGDETPSRSPDENVGSSGKKRRSIRPKQKVFREMLPRKNASLRPLDKSY